MTKINNSIEENGENQTKPQVKNEECNKLWHKWYEKFRDDPKSEETKALRKEWCKNVDELNAMIHQAYLDMPHKPQM